MRTPSQRGIQWRTTCNHTEPNRAYTDRRTSPPLDGLLGGAQFRQQEHLDLLACPHAELDEQVGRLLRDNGEIVIRYEPFRKCSVQKAPTADGPAHSEA